MGVPCEPAQGPDGGAPHIPIYRHRQGIVTIPPAGRQYTVKKEKGNAFAVEGDRRDAESFVYEKGVRGYGDSEESDINSYSALSGIQLFSDLPPRRYLRQTRCGIR